MPSTKCFTSAGEERDGLFAQRSGASWGFNLSHLITPMTPVGCWLLFLAFERDCCWMLPAIFDDSWTPLFSSLSLAPFGP